MFEKVNVPVLGLIENMSYFVSPSDQRRYEIFGSGGGEREAKRLRAPLLGQIPIDIATRESGDRGMPITAERNDSPVAAEFMKIARHYATRFDSRPIWRRPALRPLGGAHLLRCGTRACRLQQSLR